MLRSVIDYVKLSASSITGRIVGGAIIVVPFIFAFFYTLSAIHTTLTNAYGEVWASLIMAGAFAVIGIIAAFVVMARIRHQEEMLEQTRAEVKQGAFSSALLAANPALLFGVGRIALGLFRRAPLITAAAPLAAGFLMAMAAARQRRRAAETAVRTAGRSERDRRAGNSRELLH
jgi:glucan phosphoethanolaminetransferase (alkaline phosphatase superfamily)